MELSEIHDCEKSHGKIVGIEVDNLGNTYCAYCHQQVDYRPYYNNLYKEDMLNLLEELRLQQLEKEATKKWQKQKKKRRRKKEKLLVTLCVL